MERKLVIETSNSVQPLESESISIMCTGLPSDCTEEKMSLTILKLCGFLPHNIKIVRDYVSKKPKGYGYLDFLSIEKAKKVMEVSGGQIFLDDFVVQLNFTANNSTVQKDWICDSVHRSFGLLANVVNVRVIRDKITRQSRCYGFVEFSTVDEAKKALQAINTQGVIIDGSRVQGEYAKRNHLVGKDLKTFYPVSYVRRDYKKPSEENLDMTNIAVKMAKIHQKAEAEGFHYDTQTGYYFNPYKNMFFDSKTGWYYSQERGGWVTLNEETGGYAPVTQEQIREAERVKQGTGDKRKKVEKRKEKSLFGTFDPKLNDSSGDGDSLFGAFSTKLEDTPPWAEDDGGKKAETFKIAEEEKQPKMIQTQTIGRTFVPNPKFNEVMKKVEASESTRELKKLQKKVQEIKTKKKRKRRDAFPVETKEEESAARKMMKKMGWEEGKGLGVDNSGMKNPIDIHVRENRRGVGFFNQGFMKKRK